MKNRFNETVVALAAVIALAMNASVVLAATLGPGDQATTANDSGGELLAVDIPSAMALTPGVYQATDFNRQFTAANGSILPVIVTNSGTDFRYLAVGASEAVGATQPFSTVAFGGSDTFVVGTGDTVYGGVFWDETPEGAMPVGFAGTGSTYIRFGGAPAPVVGGVSNVGSLGTFTRAYDFSIDVAQQATSQVGATVSSRANSSDGATTVFWSSHHAIPYAGEVRLVDIHDQGQSGSFELFHLRSTSTTGNDFEIINRSGVISVAPAGGGTVSYVLPTHFDVLPGDVIFHRGNGLPFDQTGNTALAHNNHLIYSNPTPDPIGTTLTLGAPGNYDDSFGALYRDYAWAVQAEGGYEQVGNGTTNGAAIDGASGVLGILSGDGFSGYGRVDQWHIFSNGGTGGRSITPLILKQTATGFEVTGIGTTRVSDNSGLQMFDFDLVSGSDEVGLGYFVGWWDGSGTTANAGVVEYSGNGTFAIDLWIDGNGVAVGDIYDDGTNGLASLGSGPFARQYSINFTAIIPAPAALPAGLAMLAIVALRRRR